MADLKPLFAIKGVANVNIYDKNGTRAATIETAQTNAFKRVVDGDETVAVDLKVDNVILNKKLLQLLHDETNNTDENDFEKHLNNIQYDEFLVGDDDVPCKLILEGVYKTVEDGKYKYYQIIAPKAVLHTSLLTFILNGEDATSVPNLFTLYKFDNEHFYKLRLINHLPNEPKG